MALIRDHVLAAERIHGDDTTVPVLAKGKTITGRLWTYVRDDRPFGGPARPAAMFYFSRDRRGEHPNRHLAGYGGILQADAYAGFGELYSQARKPCALTQALCWAHGRRNFFKLAELAKAPLAIEAVRRIDAIFDLERTINGLPHEQRRTTRQDSIAPLVVDLECLDARCTPQDVAARDVAKAIDYMLKRWPSFRRFLDDGRICLTNNAAERALRGIALGRKAWLFAGSDRGGERAAAIYSLIVTAKLNDIDPRAWLADVLARIADHPASRLHELLPWHWKTLQNSSRLKLPAAVLAGCLLFTSYRCATTEVDAPGSYDAATISRFNSSGPSPTATPARQSCPLSRSWTLPPPPVPHCLIIGKQYQRLKAALGGGVRLSI